MLPTWSVCHLLFHSTSCFCLLLWHISCILNPASFALCAFTFTFIPCPTLPRCYGDNFRQRSSAVRRDQLGLSEVISGSQWVQLGELGRGRDPSPQQINVDTNYKMELVIDCGLFFCLIFFCVHVYLTRASIFGSTLFSYTLTIIAMSVLFVSPQSHRFLLILNAPATCGTKPQSKWTRHMLHAV